MRTEPRGSLGSTGGSPGKSTAGCSESCDQVALAYELLQARDRRLTVLGSSHDAIASPYGSGS